MAENTQPALAEAVEGSQFKRGHALLIGVGLDLPMTVKDAEDLHYALINPDLCSYPPEQVVLLTEEQANRERILEELDRLAERVAQNPQSMAIVYFSGHGMGGKTSRLVTYGYDPGSHDNTTITDIEFSEKLKAIQSQRLLILLDCCHAAGHFDSEELAVKSAIPIAALEELAKGSGRVVLASSRANEYSYSHKDNSYFTEALLEALSGHGASRNDGFTRVLDIALYVGRVVPERRPRKQHPVLEVWNLSDNFKLSYYAGGAKSPDLLRPLHEPESALVGNPLPNMIASQFQQLEELELESEYLSNKIAEYPSLSEAPQDLQNQLKRTVSRKIDLQGKLDLLPEQTHYGRTVTNLWSTLGVLIFFITYNIFATIQGWPALFWSAFEEIRKNDPIVGYYGFWFSVPLILAFISLTRFYRALENSADFQTRWPIAFNLPLFSDTQLRRRVQITALVFFLVLPVYWQGLFLSRMLDGVVFEKNGPPVVSGSKWAHFEPFETKYSLVKDHFRLNDPKNGPTFFPVITPWIMAGLEALLLLRLLGLYRLLTTEENEIESNVSLEDNP